MELQLYQSGPSMVNNLNALISAQKKIAFMHAIDTWGYIRNFSRELQSFGVLLHAATVNQPPLPFCPFVCKPSLMDFAIYRHFLRL